MSGLLLLGVAPALADPGDPDGDGVVGAADKCPRVPGIAPHGCPPSDRDGDQVLDHVDACPDLPGPVANRGCPDKDSDRDGVADRVDRCPQRHGLIKYQGCPPPDADGDGIEDAQDKCPATREVWNGVRDFDGCPDRPAARLQLTPTAIAFVQPLTFAAGERAVSLATRLNLRIAAALLRRLVPGVVDVVVVAEHGLSYGDSLQRARRRAAALVAALVVLLPKHVKVVASPRPADGRRRVELHYR